MTGSKSDYGEQQVLDWIYNYTGNKTPLSADLWIALYRDVINESDPADLLSEGYQNGGGAGYSRVNLNVTPGTGNWTLFAPSAGANAVQNNNQITFGALTITGPITINSVALVDTGSGAGNIIAYDTGVGGAGLNITINQGEQPQIPVNQYTHEEQ
jgi:hypothetical protein